MDTGPGPTGPSAFPVDPVPEELETPLWPNVDLWDKNEGVELEQSYVEDIDLVREEVDLSQLLCDLGQKEESPAPAIEATGRCDTPKGNMYCEVCHKYFKQLRKHKLKHTGEKPFKCSYCDHSCSQKSNMNRHVKSRHMEYKVICPLCGKEFNRPDKLKSHCIKVHAAHPGKPSNPAA